MRPPPMSGAMRAPRAASAGAVPTCHESSKSSAFGAGALAAAVAGERHHTPPSEDAPAWAAGPSGAGSASALTRVSVEPSSWVTSA